MTVGVLGAGAFGTAVAITLARKMPVILWARDPGQAEQMAASRVNRTRLEGYPFPEALSVTSDLSEAAAPDLLLIAVPMQQLRGFLTRAKPYLDGKKLVACCKGIELDTGLGPLDIIDALCPKSRAALLTGPSFAQEIARGLPAALTLACADAELAAALQQRLSTPSLRLYRTVDTIGASLGGALKNVVAIACGAAMGAGLGHSARAALMTRGNAEMQRLAVDRGARAETLSGLSGFGDLVLTCTSDQSRNYRYGLSIGTGDSFDPSTTVEGAATARALDAQARADHLDLPIVKAVAGLVEKRLDVTEAMSALLSRSLKEE